MLIYPYVPDSRLRRGLSLSNMGLRNMGLGKGEFFGTGMPVRAPNGSGARW
jgi:hypothetical protein